MYAPFFPYEESPRHYSRPPTRRPVDPYNVYPNYGGQDYDYNPWRQRELERRRQAALEEQRRRQLMQKQWEERLRREEQLKEEEMLRNRNRYFQSQRGRGVPIQTPQEEEEDEDIEQSEEGWEEEEEDAMEEEEQEEKQPTQTSVITMEPEEASLKIQRLWRGWKERQVLPKLKALKGIEKNMGLLKLMFEHYQSIANEESTDTVSLLKKLKEFEEEMTRKLLDLDAVQSGQSSRVREWRRRLVKDANASLDTCDGLKKSLEKIIQEKKEQTPPTTPSEPAAMQIELSQEGENEEDASLSPLFHEEDIPLADNVEEDSLLVDSQEEDVPVETPQLRSVSPLKNLCYQKVQQALAEKNAEIQKLKDELHTLKTPSSPAIEVC